MHPSVKILIYFTVLLTMGFLRQQAFWAFFWVAIVLVVMVQKQKFFSRCLRLKWLFLSIFALYSFGTPGEYVSNLAWEYLPTKEGVYLGAMQVAKLMLALSLLGVLFHQTKPATLMVGLQTLLSPLRLLNIDTSHFVVRLMLTLDYVDQFSMVKLDRKNFLDLFHRVQREDAFEVPQNIYLSAMPFKVIDAVALFSVIFYCWYIVSGAQG